VTADARADRAWRRSTALVGLAFLVAQVVLILVRDRGPFIDEGIYIAAGLRTLDGEGFGDGYLSWFSGSLLWPWLAGLAYEAAGLAGARVLAAACLTVAVLASGAAARKLFGARVGFWATVALATSGPVFALGHLAVYDALAVAGVAVAFWSLVRLSTSDDRLWLLPAAAALTVALLAKYPSLLFAGPSLALLLVLLRRRRALADTTILVFLVAPLPLALFIEQRGLFEILATNNVALQSGDFGVDREMLSYAQLYFLGLPLLLAATGVVLARGRRPLAAVLGLAFALVIPPAYHGWAGNAVGDHKHAVFALVLAGPLLGLTLAAATRTLPRALLALPALGALVWLAALQVDRLDAGWADPRSAAAVLVDGARPGDTFLINNSWPYILPLYRDGRIGDPWVVFDVYRIENRQHRQGLCDFDWFVEAPGGSPWPPQIRQAIDRCGSFEPVYQGPEQVVGLGADLRFIRYTAYTTIWRNTRPL